MDLSSPSALERLEVVAPLPEARVDDVLEHALLQVHELGVPQSTHLYLEVPVTP